MVYQGPIPFSDMQPLSDRLGSEFRCDNRGCQGSYTFSPCDADRHEQTHDFVCKSYNFHPNDSVVTAVTESRECRCDEHSRYYDVEISIRDYLARFRCRCPDCLDDWPNYPYRSLVESPASK